MATRPAPPMIDLHCHLLPAVDDGPPDVGAALTLAQAQVAAGVEMVAVTPHVTARLANDAKTVLRGVGELSAALNAAGIPLALVPGAELELVHALELPEEELRGLALGEGCWLLLEAPLSSPSPLEPGVAALRARGFEILLAHPERAPMLQRDPAAVRRMVGAGVRTQITASALVGRFGRTVRRFAERLLDDGLVHVVASDAHDAFRRPPGLRAPLKQAGLGDRDIARLCHENPAALLAGDTLPARARAPRRRRLPRLLPPRA